MLILSNILLFVVCVGIITYYYKVEYDRRRYFLNVNQQMQAPKGSKFKNLDEEIVFCFTWNPFRWYPISLVENSFFSFWLEYSAAYCIFLHIYITLLKYSCFNVSILRLPLISSESTTILVLRMLILQEES